MLMLLSLISHPDLFLGEAHFLTDYLTAVPTGFRGHLRYISQRVN